MKNFLFVLCIAGYVVSSCSTQPKQTGMNPFLNEYDTPYSVPPFDKIKNTDYIPAFEAGIRQQLDEIDAIVKLKKKPDFENVIVALDRSGGILRRVSSVFFGINSANTTDSLQAIDKEITPKMTGHSDDIYLNMPLFAKVKDVYEQLETSGLNDEQKKLAEETYKRFMRSGASLSAEDQAKLRVLNEEISMLQLTFGQNLLAETNGFRLHVTDQAQLKGLPQTQVEAAATAARKASEEGWLFTLHNPSVMPFLQFADERLLRKEIFEAYLNRGNNNNDRDNKAVVAKLAAKRLEKANLMGYVCYADYVLENRMAKTPQNVYALLDRIWKPAIHKAKEEAADMQSLINKQLPGSGLEAWDWRYYNEKALKSKFDLDEEMLRPYFRLENVRDGIFYVCNQLYGITFNELTNLPKYHDEAVTFECKDADGTLLGILYMDFFPRPGKRGGAWCGSYRTQTVDTQGKRVAPITTIVCNFTRPSGDAPALLSPDETETFFHEFGHALHNLFKNVTYYGTSGVPRDFVELPSQIMEHWAFEPEVLKVYAKHYQTGEALPAALVEKMEKSGKYGQGFATTEYLAASYLDMDYHILTDASHLDVPAFEKESMDKIGLIRQIPPRYRSTYFNHTMGGGYTAGYYSYIWAEVLDADAFEAFREKGNIFDKATATSFRKNILEPGGIYDAMEMYRNFRSSEPGIDALLRNRGLTE
ncbi:MAG: M3 family metallopeptidase [Bacteroidales bacterium]|nr:M3 family metallopeptidase [Bacteroidales bacterium]